MQIESLLKRQGGTKLEFGLNKLKQVVLHFKPLVAGDSDSPHVAEVAEDLMCPVQNKRVADILLDIRPRAFAVFENGEAVIPEEEAADPVPDIGEFDDSVLATLDADTVSNRWLESFCRSVLEIDPRAKSAIAELYQQNTGDKLKMSLSSTSMIRECARVFITDAKDALAIAESNAKMGG